MKYSWYKCLLSDHSHAAIIEPFFVIAEDFIVNCSLRRLEYRFTQRIS